MKRRQFFLVIFFLIFSLQLSARTSFELPDDHFLHAPLRELFHNPDMVLQSRSSLAEHGFELFHHHHRGLVVARHPKLPGHLIKVFLNDDSDSEKEQNYIRRITGAHLLKKFIAEKNLRYIQTPKKYLYPLEDNELGITTLLIVEEFAICSKSESKERYKTIDPCIVHELCTVLKKFRGLDSTIKNMPFTRDGKIAFIDTERWATVRPSLLRHAAKLMPLECQEIVDSYKWQDPFEKWLLPKEHPLHEILDKLFITNEIFDSPERLQSFGFNVNKRVHKKNMVFTHPLVPDYIFKKFDNSVEYYHQVEKYLKRLEGAEKIAQVVRENNFSSIVVPKKWLYRLPYSDDDYLVIAEKIAICDGDDDKHGDNVRCYRNLSDDTLQQLYYVMNAVGGCDAWPRNQPCTLDGKIAFIDTEHVGQKEGHFARHILPILTKEQRKKLIG